MLKFKVIFAKLKNIFAPVSPQHFVPPASQNLQEAQIHHPEIVSPDSNRQANINELRGRIIRDELVGEAASVETSTLGIVDSADEITSSKQVQSLTENGLETNNHEFLIRTAEGHLIRAEEVHNGGMCCICRKLTDQKHFLHCSVCQCPICTTCSKPFKELILCPTHYRHAVFHKNTWDEE